MRTEHTAKSVVSEPVALLLRKPRPLQRGAEPTGPLAGLTLGKDADGGLGSVQGYASWFGNVDRQGHMVRKGAFRKTLREQKGRIPMMVRHFRDAGDIPETVGAVVDLKETDKGLWFRGRFYGDTDSQGVRRKIRSALRSGVKVGASIGYVPVRVAERAIGGKRVLELAEIAVKEICLTFHPANARAQVTMAKSSKRRKKVYLLKKGQNHAR